MDQRCLRYSADPSVTYQSILCPCDTLLLVCIGIREPFDLTSLTPKEPVQIGTYFVAFARLQVVALGAPCLNRTLVSRFRHRYAPLGVLKDRIP